jgi:hypothetical protein
MAYTKARNSPLETSFFSAGGDELTVIQGIKKEI